MAQNRHICFCNFCSDDNNRRARFLPPMVRSSGTLSSNAEVLPFLPKKSIHPLCEKNLHQNVWGTSLEAYLFLGEAPKLGTACHRMSILASVFLSKKRHFLNCKYPENLRNMKLEHLKCTKKPSCLHLSCRVDGSNLRWRSAPLELWRNSCPSPTFCLQPPLLGCLDLIVFLCFS